MLIALNKPYRVLCQFSPQDGKRTLADYIDVPAVYPAGRLDYDSEGLLLLTDDGPLQARLSQPGKAIAKTYLVQVEGRIEERHLRQLEAGIVLDGVVTRPARARRATPPEPLWPREPPIRLRQAIPTDWLELTLSEGRNRQVRRMTAAVGLPTLRLIRQAIGSLDVFAMKLAPGNFEAISADRIGPDLLQKRTTERRKWRPR